MSVIEKSFYCTSRYNKCSTIYPAGGDAIGVYFVTDSHFIPSCKR